MAWRLTLPNTDNTAYLAQGIEASSDFSQSPAADCFHVEKDGLILLLEGMLLDETLEESDKAHLPKAERILKHYREDGWKAFASLKGSFSGAIVDLSTGMVHGFTNKTGDRPLYYTQSGAFTHMSNRFSDIASFVAAESECKPNRSAAYYLLTYGFMIDNSTHVDGIFKLGPGEVVSISQSRLNVQHYHRFNTRDRIEIGFDEAVDELDRRFRSSVEGILAKDSSYGGDTILSDISGGLDTRMATWVAHELASRPITNLCYSQSGAKEAKYALNVSNELGNDFIFMPLDAHNFLFDIDRIVEMNAGLAVYGGITGGERFLRAINLERFGLELTGQLGDVVVGSFVGDGEHDLPPRFDFRAYSTRLGFDFTSSILSQYANLETFAMYTRGFRGALSTHLIRNVYLDVASPFTDEDFMEFCFSLPPDYRANNRLYNAWIIEKYPIAAQLPTTRYNGPVSKSELGNFLRKVRGHGPDAVLRRASKMTGRNFQRRTSSMNPFDSWYSSSSKLREFCSNYFAKEFWRLEGDARLSADVKRMFLGGSAIERVQVLTLLAIYRKLDLSYK